MLTKIIAIAVGLACSIVPTFALAQAPVADPVVVSAIAAPCSGVTDAQRATPLAENDELDCFRAVAAAIAGVGDASAADQERVGLALLAALAAVTASPANIASAPASAIAAAIDLRVFSSCALAAQPDLRACLAATRIAVVASQGVGPDDADRVATEVCVGSQRDATWQELVFGVVDELITRSAGGTDPVMQASIAAMISARRTCPPAG